MVRTESVFHLWLLLRPLPLANVAPYPDSTALLGNQFAQVRAGVESRELFGTVDLEGDGLDFQAVGHAFVPNWRGEFVCGWGGVDERHPLVRVCFMLDTLK